MEAIQRQANEAKRRQELEVELERLRGNSMRKQIGLIDISIVHGSPEEIARSGSHLLDRFEDASGAV